MNHRFVIASPACRRGNPARISDGSPRRFTPRDDKREFIVPSRKTLCLGPALAMTTNAWAAYRVYTAPVGGRNSLLSVTYWVTLLRKARARRTEIFRGRCDVLRCGAVRTTRHSSNTIYTKYKRLYHCFVASQFQKSPHVAGRHATCTVCGGVQRPSCVRKEGRPVCFVCSR